MRFPARQRTGTILALAAALLLSACGAGGEPAQIDESFAVERIVIRNFIGMLEIVTAEAGSETTLHVDATQSQLELLPIEESGETLTIAWEGEPDRPRRWYEFWRGRWMLDLDDIEHYPSMTLTVPAGVEIEVEGMIGYWAIGDREGHLQFEAERGEGTIGATRTAEIAISGSADLEIGPVSVALDAGISGSGSLRIASAATAAIAVSGSGDVEIGPVGGDLTLAVSGSGSIAASDAGNVEVAVSGSGSVALGAVAGLDAAVHGSANITAAEVVGAFQASVSGSGGISVDSGRAEPFDVTISGSGSVRFEGTAVNPSANISGSGGLVIGIVVGELDATTAGTGNVRVLGE